MMNFGHANLIECNNRFCARKRNDNKDQLRLFDYSLLWEIL